MSDFSNSLSPAEAERLAILLEEIGEVQQVIGKILRHGYVSQHPADPTGPINRNLLEKKLAHVWYAMFLMIENQDINPEALANYRAQKAKSIIPYLHHQMRIPD